MKTRFLILLFSVFCILLPTSFAVAQDPRDPDGEVSHDPPPPPPASPTTVKVGLFIRQVTDVDQISEDFTIEAFMDWEWIDPRLAFDAEAYGYEEKLFINEEVEALLFRNEVWWPELEITNERGSRDTEERALAIHPDGTVIYRERFSAKIQADFKLRRFPFDHQEFHIYIESFIYEHHDLVIEADTHVIGFGENLGEEEWVLEKITSKITERADVRSETGDTFSELELDLELSRHIGFYVYRIFIPLISIIAIFCATFWLNNYEIQLTASTTGLLTLVAFDFAISESLPNLAYLTFLDTIVMVSFVLSALAVVTNLLLLRLEKNEQLDAARRWNRMALISFPIGYILSYILIWFVFI